MVDWHPLKRWLFTTNHKDVGVLYLVTSLYFFVAAGILALTFRTQLAVPSNTFLQPDEYNQAVTTHGRVMLLWVLTPLGAAFANYFVPIQIGARDMAFPRLNALSYWLYLASGLLALSAYFAPGGTADWGWTTYAPLNTVEFSPAVGGSMMGLALMLLMASSIVATVNFLVTIFRLRAPGMSLMRLPLFTWTWIFTSLLEAFNITTELISIPFAIIVLAYILTLRGGSIRFSTPMLFAIGSLSLFIIGGVTGVFNSSIALDSAFRGTFWVVGHFHYTIVGGGLTGLFGGLYYWFPKITGRMYNERLGKIHFVIYMIGFNLLYFPMHILYDMPRRIYIYDVAAWGPINLLITIGGSTFGISQLLMFGNLLWSARRGPVANRDPWGGYSLEWDVPSPPPEFNFPEGVPVISATGVTYRPAAMANGGHHEATHGEEHWSRWPIVVAIGAGIAFWGVLMGLPALALGTVIFAAAIAGWGRENLRGRWGEAIEAVGEKWPFARLENLTLGMWIFIFG